MSRDHPHSSAPLLTGRTLAGANLVFGVFDVSGTPSQVALGDIEFRDTDSPRSPPR
ncbi:MAG: hypothetical protein OXG30_02315 [bacterium]|nr:hypothetical protein [bacterium]MCY3890692.1 hypothetical protein [bacterium]MCY4133736.1 hypothetical protein [bacterium]